MWYSLPEANNTKEDGKQVFRFDWDFDDIYESVIIEEKVYTINFTVLEFPFSKALVNI